MSETTFTPAPEAFAARLRPADGVSVKTGPSGWITLVREAGARRAGPWKWLERFGRRSVRFELDEWGSEFWRQAECGATLGEIAAGMEDRSYKSNRTYELQAAVVKYAYQLVSRGLLVRDTTGDPADV